MTHSFVEMKASIATSQAFARSALEGRIGDGAATHAQNRTLQLAGYPRFRSREGLILNGWSTIRKLSARFPSASGLEDFAV